jgi:hypothetical protein
VLGHTPVVVSRLAPAHVDVLISWAAEGARTVGDEAELETISRERRFTLEAWRVDQRVEMYGRIVAIGLPCGAVGVVRRRAVGCGAGPVSIRREKPRAGQVLVIVCLRAATAPLGLSAPAVAIIPVRIKVRYILSALTGTPMLWGERGARRGRYLMSWTRYQSGSMLHLLR